MADGVQDLIIAVVVLAVFLWCWRHTRPMEVYEAPPEADIVVPEQFDHQGMA